MELYLGPENKSPSSIIPYIVLQLSSHSIDTNVSSERHA
jgi:hypothetical protein